MIHRIFCLDDGIAMWFDAKTPYLAMKKILYYLNLFHEDKKAVINKTESGNYLYVVHNNNTWCVKNGDTE